MAFLADCKFLGNFTHISLDAINAERFKGFVVQSSFPSLNGGSLEIMLPVPLRPIVS